MKKGSVAGKLIGCALVVVIPLLAVLGHGAYRYFTDKSAYEEAHTAYLAGDCETASPVYDEISAKFRLLDIGRISAKSKAEKQACVDYNLALNGGINALFQFAVDNPENDLVPIAKQTVLGWINDISDDSDMGAVLTDGFCDRQDELVSAGWLTAEDLLPKFLYDCSRKYLDEGSTGRAYERALSLVKDHPGNPFSAKFLGSFESRTEFCGLLPEMNIRAGFVQDEEELAGMYLQCGDNYAAESDFDGAVAMYEDFLAKFPDHPQVEAVNSSLAAALIGQARAGGAGTIDAPPSTGTAPEGVSRVVIQNDSPHKIKLVFSGPDTRIEELEACPECKDYAFVGPVFCPEQGPLGTYDLTPGDYDILVETADGDDVTPYTGEWALVGGNEFYTCFFVITR